MQYIHPLWCRVHLMQKSFVGKFSVMQTMYKIISAKDFIKARLNATDLQWQGFKEMLKSHPAKWMIWEGQPMTETVDALNAMHIQSVTFDPCGAAPSEKDFLHSMQKNIKDLEQMK